MFSNLKQVFPGLKYEEGSSIIHTINPVIKLVMLIFFSILIFSLSALTPSIVLFLVLIGGYLLSGLGLVFFIKKLRFILLFGMMIVVIQVLVVSHGYLLTSVNFFNLFSIEIWSGGLVNGLVMMLRFVNIIASSYLFVVTTDPNKLVYGLMQIGLPYRYGFMLITALRFIPVFEQELVSIRNAQMAKGMDLEGASPKKIIKIVQYLLTPLVISALSKVDHLSVSMESRAFGLYPTRSYLQKQEFKRTDWIWLACAPLLLVVMFFI